MFPGPLQILAVVAIIILLFGYKRLPGVMRSVGQSVTEFKKGINDTTDDDDDDNPTDAS